MSNNQMVSVPRDELEAACQRFAKAQIFDFSRRMRALLTQPAEQHQGEPVAWRYQSHAGGLWYLSSSEHNAHTFKDNGEGGEVQALYTQADPAEVERLRDENRRLHEAGEFLDGVNQGIEDKLRAQLAEAHALLRACIQLCYDRSKPMQDPLRAKIEAALSVSAEPEATS